MKMKREYFRNNGISPVTLTEVLLAWLLGIFGAHKFYRKKYGLGLLYLFTFGLFSIGAIGDAVYLTFRYTAQKRGAVPTKAQKYGSYIIPAVLILLLNSCGGGGSQLPEETTPTTIPETSVLATETTAPETTQPVDETTEAVTEPTEIVIETTQPVIETTETVTEATTQPTEPTEEMVWIPTGGGTKYHSRSSCSNMNNPTHVPISQAIARGFTPCKRCY